MTTLPDDIIDIDDQDEYLKIMVVGANGAGKTVLAGSAKTLILSFENGAVSARRYWGDTTGCKHWQCDRWPKFLKALKWLKEQGDSVPFEWLAIDSVPAMQERLLKYYLLNLVSAAKTEGKKIDPDVLHWEDHKGYYAKYRRYISELVDLPVDTLFLARPMLVDSADGAEIIYPQIMGMKGALAEWTLGQMSAVGYMKRIPKRDAEDIVQIQWQPKGSYVGKDRYGTLAPFTRNLTLGQISSLARTVIER